MAAISEFFEQSQLSQAAYVVGLTKGLFGGEVEGSPSAYAQLLIHGGNIPGGIFRGHNTYLKILQVKKETVNLSITYQ